MNTEEQLQSQRVPLGDDGDQNRAKILENIERGFVEKLFDDVFAKANLQSGQVEFMCINLDSGRL